MHLSDSREIVLQRSRSDLLRSTQDPQRRSARRLGALSRILQSLQPKSGDHLQHARRECYFFLSGSLPRAWLFLRFFVGKKKIRLATRTVAISQEEQAGVDPMSARFPVSTPTDVDVDARRYAFRPPRYRRGPGLGTNLIPTGRQDSMQDEQDD